MSASSIARQHFEAALQQAAAEGQDPDAVARQTLHLVIRQYLKSRSIKDVRAELNSAAENADPVPLHYTVSPARRVHILDGDRTGGGHRFGSGEGKSEFPESWPDDKIIAAIEAVANDPASRRSPSRLGRERVRGVYEGQPIIVITDPARAAVITAYPGR